MQSVVVIALLAVAVVGLIWQWPTRARAEIGQSMTLAGAKPSNLSASFLDRHGNLLRQIAVLIASSALVFVAGNTAIAVWIATATWIGAPIGFSPGWVTALAVGLMAGTAYWRYRAGLPGRARISPTEPDSVLSGDPPGTPQDKSASTAPPTRWWLAIVTFVLAAAIVAGAAKLNLSAFGTVLDWARAALAGRSAATPPADQRSGALEPAIGSGPAVASPTAMTLHPAFYVEEFLASAHDARKALDEIDNRLIASVQDYQSRGLDGLARSAQAGIESNRQAVVQHRAQARTALQLIIIALAQDRAGTTRSIADYSTAVSSRDPAAKPLLDAVGSAGQRQSPEFVAAAMAAWERAVAVTQTNPQVGAPADSPPQVAEPAASPGSWRTFEPAGRTSSSSQVSDPSRRQPRAEPERPSRRPGSARDRERYRRMELPAEEYQR